MINRHPATKSKTQSRIVASFGRANLVRTTGASYELRGTATDGDLTDAKEWVSMFMHEACVVLGEIPMAAIRHRPRLQINAWRLPEG
jgi:hypothetical protein